MSAGISHFLFYLKVEGLCECRHFSLSVLPENRKTVSAGISHFLFYLKVEGLCECGHFPLSVYLQVEGTRNLIHFYLKDEEDKIKLQRAIDRLDSWARKWGMRFQPVKCNMMPLTRKRIKKSHASYTLERTDLENVESIKYLGVTITSDLTWNTHVSNVCTKANRTLGFLGRNLYSCPKEVKEAAYKRLVRPVLDWIMAVRFGSPQV